MVIKILKGSSFHAINMYCKFPSWFGRDRHLKKKDVCGCLQTLELSEASSRNKIDIFIAY